MCVYVSIYAWIEFVKNPRGELAKEEVPHIFEPFYRASNVVDRVAGTGIGLASVSQIIEQHSGTITVQSEEGIGTTFIIHLPLMSEKKVG